MSRFSQVYEPVEEGWGMALGLIAGIILAPVGMAIPIAQSELVRNKFRKLLENPKLKKYIIGECDKIYKDAKRKWPKITRDVNPGMFEGPENRSEDDKAFLGHRSIGLRNRALSNFKIGSYTCVLIGDTEHIDGIQVLFRDMTNEKLFNINVPSPTREDIKKMGFRED